MAIVSAFYMYSSTIDYSYAVWVSRPQFHVYMVYGSDERTNVCATFSVMDLIWHETISSCNTIIFYLKIKYLILSHPAYLLKIVLLYIQIK